MTLITAHAMAHPCSVTSIEVPDESQETRNGRIKKKKKDKICPSTVDNLYLRYLIDISGILSVIVTCFDLNVQIGLCNTITNKSLLQWQVDLKRKHKP